LVPLRPDQPRYAYRNPRKRNCYLHRVPTKDSLHVLLFSKGIPVFTQIDKNRP